MYSHNTHWMITEDALQSVILQDREFANNPALAQSPEQPRIPHMAMCIDENGIAWINVEGVIHHKQPWWVSYTGRAETATDDMRELIKEWCVNDPRVKGVALTVDSPGGVAYGIHELANEIYELREKKPVYSFVGAMAASAGMYLAAAADKVYIESPTSTLGNLGCVITHQDVSGMLEKIGIAVTEVCSGIKKRLVSPFKPLTDEGKAELQKHTDHFYSFMNSDIAKFRGVTPDEAHEKLMNGQTFTGSEAVAIGLADGIKSKSEFTDLLIQAIKETPLKTLEKGGFVDKKQLAAMDGGQTLIDEIRADGFADGKKEGALEAMTANTNSDSKARLDERNRIKSILALAESHSHYKSQIHEMAFGADSQATDRDVALAILGWNKERTEQASKAALETTVDPVPGSGVNTDQALSIQGGDPQERDKAIHAAAKALMATKPGMTFPEAIAEINKLA